MKNKENHRKKFAILAAGLMGLGLLGMIWLEALRPIMGATFRIPAVAALLVHTAKPLFFLGLGMLPALFYRGKRPRLLLLALGIALLAAYGLLLFLQFAAEVRVFWRILLWVTTNQWVFLFPGACLALGQNT